MHIFLRTIPYIWLWPTHLYVHVSQYRFILKSEDLFLSPPSVCKFVSIEMKSAFDETGKTKEVIDRNYGFIDNKGAPPIKYVKS